MTVNMSCPGRYCGFFPAPNETGSICSACPKGYKTDKDKICQKCNGVPELYDWLYLGFMALLPLMLHWLYLLMNKDNCNKTVNIFQFIFSFCECLFAGFITLLLTEPTGSLTIVYCGVEKLSDWYTTFFNPQINYETTIHCTQEAVYPLSSMVFIYYGFTLLLLLLFRLLILSKIATGKNWLDPIYTALYFHPILIVTHAIIGGLLYYAFPYITILSSLGGIVAYFASNFVHRWTDIYHNSGKQYIFAILWHWLLLSYGISAVCGEKFYFIILTPIPVLFYFFTVKLTNPTSITNETKLS